MARAFPHLTGNVSGVPGSGREVYGQIEGAFDYSLWREGATLTLLSVPWGVYAPDIMTDRPGFDTIEQRDEWFANRIAQDRESRSGRVESHVLDTRVRYQINASVELPFTFDYASRYNYLIVDYPDAPLTHGGDGIKRWFYHVTDISYNSPSSTSVMLVPDWWTTVAPLLTINHMILERGHAPVAETSVEAYLKAPMTTSELLCAPDEDYGKRSIVAAHDDVCFNSGIVYAIICTAGVPLTTAVPDYAQVPIDNSTSIDGVPSAWQIGVTADKLEAFLDAWAAQASQTMQSLQAIYLVGDALVSFTGDAEVFGIPVKLTPYGPVKTHDTALTKEMFGYSADIADLAKLYTSPYAHIEITDDAGNVTEIRIEDLVTGKVSIEYALNAAYPWMRVSAHALGIGGSRAAITFRTATRHEFSAGGRWYDTLMSWDVPCFSVHQSAAQANDYRTHWDRVQRAADASTGYANATASNATAFDNVTAANNAGYVNVDNSASNATANNAVNVAANSEVNSISVGAATSVNLANANKLANDVNVDVETSISTTSEKNDYTALTATVNNAASMQHAAVGVATNVGAAIGSAAGGDVGGALNAAISGVTSVADTAINVAATNASSQIAQGTSSALTAIANKSAAVKSANAINTNTEINGYSNGAQTDIVNARNAASTSVTNNNAALMRKNAANSRDTGNANATRTRDTGNANATRTRDNALAAIDNSIKSAGMQPPLTFGDSKAGEYVTTRPMMLSVNVVTESKGAIRQAATQFLRYGYALDQAWEFDGWNLMRNFTYWKVSDIWATGIDTVPEEGQDAVRRMLYDGVTVWRDPDKIGTVSIYDN